MRLGRKGGARITCPPDTYARSTQLGLEGGRSDESQTDPRSPNGYYRTSPTRYEAMLVMPTRSDSAGAREGRDCWTFFG